MGWLRFFFDQNISEIHHSKTLRLYGSLVALLQVFSAAYWLQMGMGRFFTTGEEAVCWPMFGNCGSWRFLSLLGNEIAITAFLSFGLFSAALFFFPKKTRFAYFTLLALNIFKLVILAFDFRLRMNHHIMAFWVTLIFLFIPNKSRSLKMMIVFFYFWAGTLKLNREWLGGTALYGNLWLFKGEAIKWACAYVVVMELLIIWGVWLDRTVYAWLAWIQLILFHTFSFPIVGFFYPVLMYAILMIYPLSWLLERDEPAVWEPILKGKLAKSAYAVLAVFTLFQMLPKFMPGDTALTGEGRTFALHMFDSRTECEIKAIVHSGEKSESQNLRIPLPIRLHCDPIVYLSRAKTLCQKEKASNPDFKDLDFSLRTRRSNERWYRQIVDIKNFCSQEVQYSMFWPNKWIQK